jgi:dTDP-4-amino-4,6-dideoxygalactose transaminase
LWVEDRAQALAPEQAPFGDVLLYSPRKLFGVADGGLLVSDQPLPRAEAAIDDDRLWRPNEARAADPHGRTPERWFPALQAREVAFSIDRAPMSWRTLEALAATALKPEAAARRANWSVLAEHLADLALWPEPEADFAPLAYPVLVPDAATAGARLAEQRIWCARHWANPPCPQQSFPEAHALAAHALSVPLDSRYGAEDMARVAKAVRAAAG